MDTNRVKMLYVFPDNHGSVEAQKNIYSGASEIIESGEMGTMFIEGAPKGQLVNVDGYMSCFQNGLIVSENGWPHFVKNYVEEGRKKGVLFVKKQLWGRHIGAGMFLAMMHSGKIPFYGMEDEEHKKALNDIEGLYELGGCTGERIFSECVNLLDDYKEIIPVEGFEEFREDIETLKELINNNEMMRLPETLKRTEDNYNKLKWEVLKSLYKAVEDGKHKDDAGNFALRFALINTQYEQSLDQMRKIAPHMGGCNDKRNEKLSDNIVPYIYGMSGEASGLVIGSNHLNDLRRSAASHKKSCPIDIYYMVVKKDESGVFLDFEPLDEWEENSELV